MWRTLSITNWSPCKYESKDGEMSDTRGVGKLGSRAKKSQYFRIAISHSACFCVLKLRTPISGISVLITPLIRPDSGKQGGGL